MDKYWICGNMDGIGESPATNVSQPLLEAVHQPDDEAWEKIIRQPDAPASLQELTEILNEIDRLRDSD